MMGARRRSGRVCRIGMRRTRRGGRGGRGNSFKEASMPIRKSLQDRKEEGGVRGRGFGEIDFEDTLLDQHISDCIEHSGRLIENSILRKRERYSLHCLRA
jgi:hypothetical protein